MPEDINRGNNEDEQLTEQQLGEQRQIRRDKLQSLRDAGSDPFLITTFEKTHLSAQITEGYDALEGKDVAVAGRMMSRRVMGKASFANVKDELGNIQIYVKRDDIGTDEYMAFKAFDIGDVVGIKGFVFRTRTGEISIHAKEVVLLAKSLIPLPEKFHGLTDTDMRYRQRYVDLIMNDDSRKTFVARSKIVSGIRKFLDGRGFMEVETPILQTTAGGANARPFITHHNTLDMDMYLRIATELHLKRLIVGGFERVYEIGRIFRNEGMSVKHNPEFTTVELYQAYTDVYGMMEITEAMIVDAARNTLGDDLTLEFDGNEISLAPPFRQVSMSELVKEKTGLDFTAITDEEARAEAKKLGIEDTEGMSRGAAMYAIFDEKIEHTLIQPTFVLDYPVEASPLAKKRADMPWLTQRFELFISGREMANAYSELNDPIDQYERFVQQEQARAKGDDEAHEMDEDFVTALEYGMPPTGGMGLGIDRLVQLLTSRYTIRDVLLFPTMRPKN